MSKCPVDMLERGGSFAYNGLARRSVTNKIFAANTTDFALSMNNNTLFGLY